MHKIDIPERLKKLNFVRCLKGTKKPYENAWQDKRLKYSDILSHIKCGNNYGVLCGVDGLVVVDFDNQEFYEDQSIFFPDTFEVKTPKKGYHKYLKCFDLDGNAIIYNKDGKQVGEIRYSRLQVIGPSSIHPDTKTPYLVHQDTEIAEIDAKELISLFGEYEVRFTRNRDDMSGNFDNCTSEIYPAIKDLKLTKNGDEYQGEHPIHGSTSGNNFTVNISKNVFYCFRHGVGGSAIHLVAIREGIISCEDVGKLKGKKYKNACDMAREKYEISPPEIKKEESIILAETFLNHHKIVFCEEGSCFYIYKNNYYQPITTIDINKMFLDIPGWQKLTLPKIKNVFERLKVLVGKHLEEFNTDLYLNLDNGIYDMAKEELLPHTEEYLSTIRLPYNYDKEAKCDRWLKFLESSIGDSERIQTLQEFMGYAITKETQFEQVLCLTGEGRNGKGVVTHVLHEVIGEENVSDLGLEHFGNTQMIRVLVNKMINISEEVRENAINFEAEFKKISSGERITVNQKYVDVYEFKPFCKLIMNINNFPRINDKTRAFYERLLIIPFDRIFESHERDATLKQNLTKEELPGILNWMLKGQKRLFKRGYFIITKEMKDKIKELRAANNPAETFMDDNIERAKGEDHITKDSLYETYCVWCNENGHYKLNKANLCKAVYSRFKIKPNDKHRESFGDRKRYIPFIKFIDKNNIKTEEIQEEQVTTWGEEQDE